jgi:AbrB family looped-hinge helix DNA binding protein
MATVTVSKKGWVVIPREIRERYGIRPGDKVEIVDYAGRIAIIPALEDPVRQGRGLLKGGPSLTKALLDERRREREREERGMQRWAGHKKAS